MRYGLKEQIGSIVTPSGAASGVSGANLNLVIGDGNAAGNASGGSLNITPGSASGTGSGGSVNILPFNSTAGSTSALRFFGINSTNFVAFRAADTVTNTTWTLPTADGSPNQFLQTNGSGVLAWASVTAANVFATIAGNTGSAVVDATADTLTFTGSVGINTVASDTAGNDVLTISLTRTGINAKATPVAADQFLMFDSAASNGPVHVTATALLSSLNIVTAAANGVLVRTAANTYASRTLTASSTAAQQGIIIANGDGVSANPTIGLNVNGLTSGSVVAATTLPAFDGTNNVKVTPAQIVTTRIVRATFVNAGLTAGSIAITHNLNVSNALIQVYDENNQLVQPDNITLTSNNVATVDLSSFGTITGTWSYVIFG